jgi:phage FluMu protein gp41
MVSKRSLTEILARDVSRGQALDGTARELFRQDIAYVGSIEGSLQQKRSRVLRARVEI